MKEAANFIFITGVLVGRSFMDLVKTEKHNAATETKHNASKLRRKMSHAGKLKRTEKRLRQ